MTLTEEQRGTVGFDLERARGLRDFLQDDCAEVGDVWAEMIAEIERLRSAALRGNQLISELMANCNSLRARAWKAEARIKELEDALVEERAWKLMLQHNCESSFGGEHVKDLSDFLGEARQQLKDEGKIGPDAALKKQWDEVLSEAAIHKKMEELPTAPGAYRPAIREEAIRQLNTMRSWQITDERKAALKRLYGLLVIRYKYSYPDETETLRSMLQEAGQ